MTTRDLCDPPSLPTSLFLPLISFCLLPSLPALPPSLTPFLSNACLYPSLLSFLLSPTAGKLCGLLLQGLSCKNKRTRVVCIEEIQEVVEAAGATALGRAGVKEIAVYLDSKDNDVNGRNACLELCNSLSLSLGAELPKLMKLMGTAVSERTTSMIEDRIRQKNKQAGGVSAALANFANHCSSSQSATSQAASASAASRAPLGLSVRTAHTEDSSEFMSPNRQGSRESYETSPSPFRLEITPPATITEEQRAKVRQTSLASPDLSSPPLSLFYLTLTLTRRHRCCSLSLFAASP